MPTPPRWDLSNVYPSLSSKEFKAAVADYKRQVASLEKFFDKKLSTAGPSTPARELAPLVGDAINRINRILSLSGTIAPFIYSYVTTNSREQAAMRALSEFEQASLPMDKLITRFRSWLGRVDSKLDKIIAIEQAGRRARLHAQRSRRAEPLSDERRAGGPRLRAEPQRRQRLRQTAGHRYLPAHRGLRAGRQDPEAAHDRADQPALAPGRGHTSPRLRRGEQSLGVGQGNAGGLPERRKGRGHHAEQAPRPQRCGRSRPRGRPHRPQDPRRPCSAPWKPPSPCSAPTSMPRRRSSARKSSPGGISSRPLARRTRPTRSRKPATFVLENFGKFSPDLQAFAQRAFDNGWIDAEPRDGKRGGAFCMGIASVQGEPRACATSTAPSTRSAPSPMSSGTASTMIAPSPPARPNCSSSPP